MDNKEQEYLRIISHAKLELQNLYECVEHIGEIMPSGHEQKANPDHFLAILERIIINVEDLFQLTQGSVYIKVRNELANIKNEDINIESIKRSSTENAYEKMRSLYICVENTLKPII